MDFSDINLKIKNIHRTETESDLREEDVKSNPFEQFLDWFSVALASKNYDPSAMLLATVDEQGWPDARVVLLKEVGDNRLIFFTSYNSNKAKQLANNNIAAVNFYWPLSSRQVRMKGTVKKVDRGISDAYFATRPRATQIASNAFSQSSVIKDRNELEEKISVLAKEYGDKPIVCSENWGGFEFIPFEYEFFQGRKWRMHDRLLYKMHDNKWKIVRLAP